MLCGKKKKGKGEDNYTAYLYIKSLPFFLKKIKQSHYHVGLCAQRVKCIIYLTQSYFIDISCFEEQQICGMTSGRLIRASFFFFLVEQSLVARMI